MKIFQNGYQTFHDKEKHIKIGILIGSFLRPISHNIYSHFVLKYLSKRLLAKNMS